MIGSSSDSLSLLTAVWHGVGEQALCGATCDSSCVCPSTKPNCDNGTCKVGALQGACPRLLVVGPAAQVGLEKLRWLRSYNDLSCRTFFATLSYVTSLLLQATCTTGATCNGCYCNPATNACDTSNICRVRLLCGLHARSWLHTLLCCRRLSLCESASSC